MMSWLRPHWKVVVRVPSMQVVKRQSIWVYGGGRSTRDRDPKSVKWESTREEGRQEVGEASSTVWDNKELIRPLGQGAGRQMHPLQHHFRHYH